MAPVSDTPKSPSDDSAPAGRRGTSRRVFLGGAVGTVVGAAVATSVRSAAADPVAGQAGASSVGTLEWAKPRLINGLDTTHPYPFSFSYGGQSSDVLLPQWSVSTGKATYDDTGQRRTRIVTWTAPDGLQVSCHYVDFPEDFGSALDIVLWFANPTSHDSDIISNVLPLDLRFTNPISDGASSPYLLHRTNGNAGGFRSRTAVVSSAAGPQHLSHGYGYSSFTDLPFFKLDHGTGSLITAIGWTGTWAADLAASDANQLHLTSGLQVTNFRLHAREAPVRSPRALVYGNRDGYAANSQFRQLVYTHYQARLAGKKFTGNVYAFDSYVRHGNPLFTDACTAPGWEANPLFSADAETAVLAAFKPLRLGTYTQDATYFVGPNGNTCPDIGEYRLRPDYPNAFVPMADLAKKNKLSVGGYGVWYDPEFAGPGTYLEDPAQHGGVDYCYPETGPYFGERRLDWGLVVVPDFFFNMVKSHVDSSPGFRNLWQDGVYVQGIDSTWHNQDADDRQGITEMRHVTGMYQFWERLATLAGGSVVRKNCAGGGTRIDLESVMHMHWNQTSDDSGGDPTNELVYTWALGQYLPNSCFDTFMLAYPGDADDVYAFDAGLAANKALAWDPTRSGFNMDRAIVLRARYDVVAPHVNGGWYPLTDGIPTSAGVAWVASQYYAIGKSDGLVAAYRPPAAPEYSPALRMHDLPADRYQLRDVDGRFPPVVIDADTLERVGFGFSLPSAGSSALIRYTPSRKAVTPMGPVSLAGPQQRPTLIEGQGGSVPVDVRLGLSGVAVRTSVVLTVPSGWTVTPSKQSVVLPPGGGTLTTAPFSVTAPIGSSGTYVLEAVARYNGTTTRLDIPVLVAVPGAITDVSFASGTDGLVAGQPAPVVVDATAASATSATVTLTAPANWTVSPASVTVNFADGALTQSATFTVTPPADAFGPATLHATAASNQSSAQADATVSVGRVIALVGTVDESPNEFALAPVGLPTGTEQVAKYQSTFPHGCDFTFGVSDPAKDWCYIQPGPAEDNAWGGGQRTFTFRFQLSDVPAHLSFVGWLQDTAVIEEELTLALNGAAPVVVTVGPGLGGGAYSGGKGKEEVFRASWSAAQARTGENVVTVENTKGSWVVWDAFGIVANQ